MSKPLIPSVDPTTFLLPEPTMAAILAAVPGISPDDVQEAVEAYFDENPLEGATTDYVDDAVTAHANAVEPHAAYDDMPSLTLIFENHLL